MVLHRPAGLRKGGEKIMNDDSWLKGEICGVVPRIRIRVYGIGILYLGIDKLPSNLLLQMYTSVEVQLDAKHERIVNIRKPLQ